MTLLSAARSTKYPFNVVARLELFFILLFNVYRCYFHRTGDGDMGDYTVLMYGI